LDEAVGRSGRVTVYPEIINWLIAARTVKKNKTPGLATTRSEPITNRQTITENESLKVASLKAV
jgi:hypothetical protein